MRRTIMLIRSMDGPLRVLTHLTRSLRTELDKTSRDLQEEFPITETGVEGSGKWFDKSLLRLRRWEGGRVGGDKGERLANLP